MTARVEIDGVDNLLNKLEKLGAKKRRIENIALKNAGEKVKEAIKSEAPVRTGTLKKSIERSNVKTKQGVKRVEVGPTKEGWYGVFVNFGTINMKANPFMDRGYEKSKGEAMEIIKNEIKKGLGL